MRFVRLLLLGSVLAYGGELVIVVSARSALDAISARECRDVFLKKRMFVGADKVIPVNISAGHPLRSRFERQELKMGQEELAGYWTNRHYNGVSAPTVQPSVESVKSFVKNVGGAIGYLDSGDLDDDLKVLRTVKP